MAYEIGDKVWFRGDEVTVTSAPYILHGGTFVDAVTETGKVVTVATPAERDARAEQARADWQAEQAGFRRLRGEGA